MKYLTPFIILLAITITSRADMGYFGSIAQNTVPSDTFVVHPFIELTCEYVVIEVFPGGKAEDAIYRAEMYEDGSAGWPSSLRVIVENGGLKYL